LKKRLVLIDFDGTITTRDTLFELIRYQKGNVAFYLGLFILSPIFFLYKLKILPNWRAKEIVLTYFFKNTQVDEFQQKCDLFSKHKIPPLVKPKALKTIQEYKRSGDHIAVITASLENWVQVWCQDMDIDLIGTQIVTNDGVVTGKIKGKNCYGIEKANRVKSKYNLEDFREIHAYGDSAGDQEMLEMADHRYFKKL